MKARAALAAVCIGLSALPVRAQARLSGEVSVQGATFPNRARSSELRARAYVKEEINAGSHFRFDIGGFLEGLLARGAGPGRDGAAEVDEASVTLTFARVDILAGFTRAVWGRLDEIQPSDVVNPLDLSKFLFDSREAARMPVGLIRARLHLTKSTTIELVSVPAFRKGRFDRLDEPNSPFTPAALPLRTVQERPAGSVWERMQGGARFTTSIKQVDWSAGAYHGFRPLQVYTLSYVVSGLQAAPIVAIRVGENYPRFTMVSGDFETALRKWTIRGEVVVSDDDAVQAHATPVTARARTIQAGFGADRSIAGFRVLSELVWHRASFEAPSLATDPLTDAPPRFDRQSLTAVGIAERQFAQGTRLVRGFGIYDGVNRNGIVRGIGAISLREGLWLEGTGVWCSGRRTGFLGPFVDSDFVSVRMIQRF